MTITIMRRHLPGITTLTLSNPSFVFGASSDCLQVRNLHHQVFVVNIIVFFTTSSLQFKMTMMTLDMKTKCPNEQQKDRLPVKKKEKKIACSVSPNSLPLVEPNILIICDHEKQFRKNQIFVKE